MNNFFREIALYGACFFAGCAFTVCIFGWSLHAHRIQASEKNTLDAQSTLRGAFGFALRQLAFFLTLGSTSFLLSGWMSFARSKASNPAPITTAHASDRKIQSSLALSSPFQNSSSENRSRLTAVLLPRNAQVVSEQSVLNTSSEQLQALTAQIDADSRLDATEVLIWQNGYSRATASSLIRSVRKNLNAGGWLYKETRVERGVREFVAVHRARKKVVPGFWLITDEFLLLSWGELEAEKS